MLSNHITFAKNCKFGEGGTPRCECENDHATSCKIRGENAPYYKKLLSLNSKTIPYPDDLCVKREIENFCEKLFALAQPFLPRDTTVTVPAVPGRTDLLRYTRNPNFACVQSDVLRVKREYPNHVFSPLDKNIGAFLLVCPKTYYENLQVEFLENPCYERVVESETQILKNWKNTFKNQNFKVFGNFAQNSSIPYAYILFKNKDLERRRPIVSYRQHPLRNVEEVVCKCLQFALQTVKLPHMNLTNLNDMAKCISDWNATCEKNNLGNVTCRAYDVKSAFTSLEHSDIVKCVHSGTAGARIRLEYDWQCVRTYVLENDPNCMARCVNDD